MLQNWSAEAFNQVPDSSNQIHGDEISRQYGFQGGLVPGVTVSAYLMHPAVVAWGREFLDHGRAHVRVVSPLYDEERFEVAIVEAEPSAYRAELFRPCGTKSAMAEVEIPAVPIAAPERRGDPVRDADFVGPVATPEHWAALKSQGCHAIRYRWGARHAMAGYLRDASGMPELLRLPGGFANPSWILGISNWMLASNAHMNPWVHLETTSQHYRAIAPETMVVAEMVVADWYEKKGHRFVDAQVTLFDEADDAALAHIDLRAIYQLRGMNVAQHPG